MIDLFFYDWSISHTALVVGLLNGLIYAAIAAGLVLIYRSTGVLNFAHGEMAAFSVVVFAVLEGNLGLNWYIAFALAILTGATVGLVAELAFVRRLFDSPRLVLFIATIGMSGLLFAGKFALRNQLEGGAIEAPFDIVWEIGSVRLASRELLVIFVIPLAVLALGWFLNFTKFGLRVRASADNPDTARVYGISPRRTSTIVWTLAGAYAALTGILFATAQSFSAGQLSQSSLVSQPLLLRALAVGLIARMRSLNMVLLGGLLIGGGESIVKAVVPSTERNIVDGYLFLAVIVLVLLAVRGNIGAGQWSLSPKVTAIPDRLKRIWWVRHSNRIGFGLLFLGLALVPWIDNYVWFIQSPNNAWIFYWSNVIIFMMVVQSVTLLTGWAGQLSLGQYAFTGLGAMTTLAVNSGHDIPIPFDLFDLSVEWPWFPSVVAGTVVGILAALLIGLPALRVKGLFLAVATMAFAVAAASWLLIQDVFTDGSSAPRPIDPPSFLGVDFAESRTNYYLLLVACLGGITYLLARLRRTGVGRSIIAVRENEDMAQANTLSLAKAKLTAFMISGGIAAFAGSMLITLLLNVTPGVQFGAGQSIDVVSMAVVGGLGSVAGPILGVLLIKGSLSLWNVTTIPETIQLLTGPIGLLILLMYFPGGLLQIVYKGRDTLFEWAGRRLPEESVDTTTPAIAKAVSTRGQERDKSIERPLVCRDVTVRFGGNLAVDTVSIHLNQGELLGLIGSNGAGKSTLMNAISGFVPSTGSIEVLGQELAGLSAHERHRLGLGRGFQAARLYPDLTVRETLMVALEAREATQLFGSLTGLPPSPRAERAKRAEADEIIDLLGLGRFADEFVSILSTGTRRIVELGSLIAVDAQVLLLDEPTGGVAQKETEAFGPLIRNIKEQLDASVIVIEHDMPLIMDISDRVYCLEAGQVIAEGEPDHVRNHPAVIASYLGTDERAIDRSSHA